MLNYSAIVRETQALRKRTGRSQRYVASGAGTTAATISRFEAGEQGNIGVKLLDRIVTASGGDLVVQVVMKGGQSRQDAGEGWE